jgi:putative tricarboxylic transport membrane protein
MKERIVAVALLLFALVYMAGSVALKVGTLAAPGAGQFPAFVAAVMLAVTGWHCWSTFRKTAGKDESHSWTQIAPAGIAVALLVYPIMLRTLSYLLATFLVLFALFRLLGIKRWQTVGFTAVLTTVLSFVIFAGLLGVVLPTGFAEQSLLNLIGVGG